VNRLILRLMRPYLLVALLLTAGATTYLFAAAAAVQHRLDAKGVPDCVNPNVCWPTGGAMDAILGAELFAATTPFLLGLLLGVPLFAREREEDTAAFVLTQSVPARRWATAKLAWAAAAAALCTAVVGLTYRLVMARYTLLANDLYELLELLHLNNPLFMVAVSASTAVTAGVIGLISGSTARTFLLTLVWWPFGLIIAFGGAALLGIPLALLPIAPTRSPELSPEDDRYWTADISLMDGLAQVAATALAAYVVAIVWAGRRTATRAAR
jgi:ABC-type transport system involved in multi-copper enzyme maturation permease subunit